MIGHVLLAVDCLHADPNKLVQACNFDLIAFTLCFVTVVMLMLWHAPILLEAIEDRRELKLVRKRKQMKKSEKNAVPVAHRTSQADQDDMDHPENTIIDHAEDIIDHPKDIVDHPKDIIDHHNAIIDHPEDIIDHAKDIIDHPKDIIDHPEDVIDHPKDIIDPAEDIIDHPE